MKYTQGCKRLKGGILSILFPVKVSLRRGNLPWDLEDKYQLTNWVTEMNNTDNVSESGNKMVQHLRS